MTTSQPAARAGGEHEEHSRDVRRGRRGDRPSSGCAPRRRGATVRRQASRRAGSARSSTSMVPTASTVATSDEVEARDGRSGRAGMRENADAGRDDTRVTAAARSRRRTRAPLMAVSRSGAVSGRPRVSVGRPGAVPAQRCVFGSARAEAASDAAPSAASAAAQRVATSVRYRHLRQRGEVGTGRREGVEHLSGPRVRSPCSAPPGCRRGGVGQVGVQLGESRDIGDIGASRGRRDPIVHPLSSLRCPSSSASRARPRAHRLFTVPTGTSRIAPPRRPGSPARRRARRRLRCSTGSSASASPTTIRVASSIAGSAPRDGRSRTGPRHGPPYPLVADPVDAGVDDDAAQPGAHGRVAAVRRRAAVRRDQRLLHGVRGVVGIAQRAQSEGPEIATVPLHQQPERLRVAPHVRGQQLGVAARSRRRQHRETRAETRSRPPLAVGVRKNCRMLVSRRCGGTRPHGSRWCSPFRLRRGG